MQQTTNTVTTASEVLIDYSALGKCRYMLIQNTHASNILYVRLDGATATAGNGIRINAGKAFELSLPEGTYLNKDITGIADASGTTTIIAYHTLGA